jgi:hypothetical protein
MRSYERKYLCKHKLIKKYYQILRTHDLERSNIKTI